MAQDMNDSVAKRIKGFFQTIGNFLSKSAYTVANQISPVAALQMSNAMGKEVPDEILKKLQEKTVKMNLAMERRRAKYLHSIDDIISKPKRNPVDNIDDIRAVCKDMAKATGDCDIVIKVSHPKFDKDTNGKKIDKKNKDEYLRFKAEYNKKGKFTGISIYKGSFPGNYKPGMKKTLNETVWEKCKIKDAAYLLGQNDKGKKTKEKISFELMDKGRRDVILSSLNDKINKIYNPTTKEDKKRFTGKSKLDRETKKIRAIKNLIEEYRREYGIPGKDEVYRIPLQGKPNGKSYEIAFIGGRKGKNGMELPGKALICQKGETDLSNENKCINYFKLSEGEKLRTINKFIGLGEHYPAKFRNDVIKAIDKAFRDREGKLVRGKEVYSSVVPFTLNSINYLAQKKRDNTYIITRLDGNGHKFALEKVIDKATGKMRRKGFEFPLDPNNKDDIGFQYMYNSEKGSSAHAYAVVAQKAIDLDEEMANIFRQYGKKDKNGNIFVDVAEEKGKAATRFYIDKEGNLSAVQNGRKLSLAERNRIKASVIASRIVPNDIKCEIRKKDSKEVDKAAASMGIKKNLSEIKHEVPKNIKKYLKEKALNFLDINQPDMESAEKKAKEVEAELKSGSEKSADDVSKIIKGLVDEVGKNPDLSASITITYTKDGDMTINISQHDLEKNNGKITDVKTEETIKIDGKSEKTEPTISSMADLANDIQKAKDTVTMIAEPISQEKDLTPAEQVAANKEIAAAEKEIAREAFQDQMNLNRQESEYEEEPEEEEEIEEYNVSHPSFEAREVATAR